MYKASKDPIVFAEVCAKAGAKYPQDVESAMIALEAIGHVERLTVKGNEHGRVAYRWIAA